MPVLTVSCMDIYVIMKFMYHINVYRPNFYAKYDR